jgi:hypothetical protein
VHLVAAAPCTCCSADAQPQEASGADSDEDWSLGAKKGKKGKGAAAGKGKGGKAAPSNSSSGSGAGGKQQQKGAPDVNSILSISVLAQQVVLELYPDMEDAGEQHSTTQHDTAHQQHGRPRHTQQGSLAHVLQSHATHDHTNTGCACHRAHATGLMQAPDSTQHPVEWPLLPTALRRATLCCAMLCAGASGSLPKALAEVVRPAAVAAYQEALASVLTSDAVAKKKQKEEALKRLDESFVLLQLYANGADLLQVRQEEDGRGGCGGEAGGCVGC